MSSSFATKVHSITFRSKKFGEVMNTWDDWHMIPTSRPVINPPSVNTHYLDIPGADGSIDLTDLLTGGPTFGDREGSIEFMILNDYDLPSVGASPFVDQNQNEIRYDWISVYSDLMKYFHGKKRLMAFDDDPNNYYFGRFSVNSWKSDRDRSIISLDYRVDPYRYNMVRNFTADEFEGPGLTIDKSTGNDAIPEIGELSYSMRTKGRVMVNLNLSGSSADSKLTVPSGTNPNWVRTSTNKLSSCTIDLSAIRLGEKPKKIRITSNGLQSAITACLKEYNPDLETAVGTPVEFATGYNSRDSATASSVTKEYTVTSDFNYLYVLIYDTSRNDHTPIIEVEFENAAYMIECHQGDILSVHRDKVGTGSEDNPYKFAATIYTYNKVHSYLEYIHYSDSRTIAENEYRFPVDGYFRISTFSYEPLTNYTPETVPTRNDIIEHIANSFTIYRRGDKF